MFVVLPLADVSSLSGEGRGLCEDSWDTLVMISSRPLLQVLLLLLVVLVVLVVVVILREGCGFLGVFVGGVQHWGWGARTSTVEPHAHNIARLRVCKVLLQVVARY